MKAVILAGGEGTRLRPVSLGLPKPMTPLLDRPVMEHTITRLKRFGLTQICVTLAYMPRTVIDYFGDGSRLGVSLTYFTEETPLGTAGSVKACMDFLGEEDFLVVSGDAVWDLDLPAALAFHRSGQAAATLILSRQEEPLEYGLVVTDQAGRVERFLEKPSWGEVVTDRVNTGIYLLTKGAMDLVPRGQPFDFGKDLFPLLLRLGKPVLGWEMSGYWRDMGDCPSYLRCLRDCLDGRTGLAMDLPRRGEGVWSAQPIPPGVEVLPPCYIAPRVSLAPGARIGPYTVLGAGSSVGEGALVEASVLHGAGVGPRATVYGAILCKNARAGAGCILNAGSVLGEEARMGKDSVLMESVRVWPRRQVSPGLRLRTNLVSGDGLQSLRFSDGGVICGAVGEELTAEAMLLLGGVLGEDGRAGLGWSGGEAAAMLAGSLRGGLTSAGCGVLLHDGPSPSAAAWLAERYALPISLFVQQEEDRVFLHLFDRCGLPLPKARQRRIEGALARGEVTRVGASQVGRGEPLLGVSKAYAADAARRGKLEEGLRFPVTVSVPGRGGADQVMAGALSLLGCTVLRQERKGVPGFLSLRGGTLLSGWDEGGKALPPERILSLVALVEFQDGSGLLPVPAMAPASLETLGRATGGTVLRLGRDGLRAQEHYAGSPWVRDAVFAACRLCARLGKTGEPLRSLDGKVPLFTIRRREIPLRGERGQIMEALLRAAPQAQQTGEGLRFRTGDGWVAVTPLLRRRALRLAVESFDAETARELCESFSRKLEKLDRGGTW